MKSSIKAVRVALVVVGILRSILSVAEGLPPRLPTDAEIEELYSATNRADVLYQRMGDLLKSMRLSPSAYQADELRHVQSVLLTNIVTCPLEQHVLDLSTYSKENLLKEACLFSNLVCDDLNSLMYVIDYLGSLQIVATNSLPAECMVAWNADAPYREQLGTNFYGRTKRACNNLGRRYLYPQQTPNMNRYLEKWMPIVSYNSCVPRLRLCLVSYLGGAVGVWESKLDDISKAIFRTNVIERARLDEWEKQEWFGGR